MTSFSTSVEVALVGSGKMAMVCDVSASVRSSLVMVTMWCSRASHTR